MPTLLIKEVPPAVDEFLSRSAAQNHRSKEKQALTLLEQAASRQAVDWTDFFSRPRRKGSGLSDEIRKLSR